MGTETLLILILLLSALCLIAEQQFAWMGHISGVCLLIMVASLLCSVNLVPAEHPMYDLFMGDAVPLAIVLLLFSIHIEYVKKLPKSFLIIFTIGALGSTIGGIIAGVIGHYWIGENAWKLAAQLTASYVGGGENAVAMKKMLDIPNEYFIAAFAVDNVLTSLWLVFNLAICRNAPIRDLNIDVKSPVWRDGEVIVVNKFLMNIAVALFTVVLSRFAAQYIGFMHQMLWLSALAIAIGHIPVLRPYLGASYTIGTLIFFPFFFSIGAVSDMRKIAELPLVITAMPFIVVFVHAAILFTASWLLKHPLSETVIASQAVIGGPGTAAAMAQSLNWKTGVTLGLIAGIMGYATGNYAGQLVFSTLRYFLGG